jgi:hypothetical protein
METAHQQPAVVDAAKAFLAAPVRGMVKILSRSLYSYYPDVSHRSIVIAAGMDTSDHESAFEMLRATNAINKLEEGPRQYARGAMLEKIAEELLKVRLPGLLTEQCIGPLDGPQWTNGMSDPIDFVSDTAPEEFYDAKSAINRIESKHLNQFRLILGLASNDARAGFITLAKASDLADYLAVFQWLEGDVYAYTVEDFEAMADDRPTTQVA